jgi:hypothetical protein
MGGYDHGARLPNADRSRRPGRVRARADIRARAKANGQSLGPKPILTPHQQKRDPQPPRSWREQRRAQLQCQSEHNFTANIITSQALGDTNMYRTPFRIRPIPFRVRLSLKHLWQCLKLSSELITAFFTFVLAFATVMLVVTAVIQHLDNIDAIGATNRFAKAAEATAEAARPSKRSH